MRPLTSIALRTHALEECRSSFGLKGDTAALLVKVIKDEGISDTDDIETPTWHKLCDMVHDEAAKLPRYHSTRVSATLSELARRAMK